MSVQGQRAVAIVVACLLATVVAPPLFAWTINQRRVARAEHDAATIAGALLADESRLRQLANSINVLCGPGLPPRAASASEQWISGPRAPLSAVLGEGKVPVDPWGNCYAVNLAAMRDGSSASVLVLSAGPNGILETPVASTEPLANDVGAKVR